MVKIFKSKFKLNFVDEKLEKKYDKYFLKLIRENIKKLSIFYFLAYLIPTILMSFYFKFASVVKFKISPFYTFLLIMTLLITAIIVYFFKSVTGFKIFTLFHYYLLFFIFMDYKFVFLKVSNFLYFTLICNDMCTRLLLVLLGIFNFPSLLFANLSLISSFWFFYFGYTSKEADQDLSLMLIGIAYTISISIVAILSYFLIKHQKINFFYTYTTKKLSWTRDVLNTMNTGFLAIKKNKISYVNSYLVDFMKQSKDFYSKISSSSVEKDEKCKVIVQDFKTKLYDKEFSDNLTQEFASRILKLENTSKFFYIGEYCMEKEFQTGENFNDFTYFEIFCRIKQKNSNKTEINFMFKDVTSTKLREKRKSEFELKTLFFSKIAHEFKNPLICINELIKETKDIDEVAQYLSTCNKFNKNFNQITSMSNFLIIMVRDLEYFSQMQMDESSNVLIEKQDTKLEDVLIFVEEICNSLIKKTNKSDVLNFVIKKAENVPSVIFTDECRLKQVLVNLVSNAVKFTLNGEICLNITKEGEWIKFEVIDTGIGIKEEMIRKIFIPYGRENRLKNECFGCGLGLCIVKNLTSRLGKEIEVRSDESGSSFWFSIPDERPNQEIHSSNSFNTVNKSFNLDKNQLNEFLPYSESNKSNNAMIDKISNYSNGNGISLLSKKNSLIKIEEENNQPIYNEPQIVQPEVEQVSNVNNAGQNIFDKINLNTLPNLPTKNKFMTSSNIADQNVKNKLKLKSLLSSKFMQLKEQPKVNVIVADDEKIIRKAEKRLLMEAASLHQLQMNVIEAEDGYDTLYIMYKCLQQGITINLILSDQTMNYLTGSKSFKLVSDLLMSKNLQTIPFFLVTAYDKVDEGNLKIYSKPLNFQKVEEILREIKLI